jgi:hypothetical protein
MTRTYNPNLDNVYINRDGTIRWDGDAIGTVSKLSAADARLVGGQWRAEVGDPVHPEQWPRYRATYSRTRRDAVADVLDGLEAPDERRHA